MAKTGSNTPCTVADYNRRTHPAQCPTGAEGGTGETHDVPSALKRAGVGVVGGLADELADDLVPHLDALQRRLHDALQQAACRRTAHIAPHVPADVLHTTVMSSGHAIVSYDTLTR